MAKITQTEMNSVKQAVLRLKAARLETPEVAEEQQTLETAIAAAHAELDKTSYVDGNKVVQAADFATARQQSNQRVFEVAVRSVQDRYKNPEVARSIVEALEDLLIAPREAFEKNEVPLEPWNIFVDGIRPQVEALSGGWVQALKDDEVVKLYESSGLGRYLVRPELTPETVGKMRQELLSTWARQVAGPLVEIVGAREDLVGEVRAASTKLSYAHHMETLADSLVERVEHFLERGELPEVKDLRTFAESLDEFWAQVPDLSTAEIRRAGESVGNRRFSPKDGSLTSTFADALRKTAREAAVFSTDRDRTARSSTLLAALRDVVRAVQASATRSERAEATP